MRTTDYIKVGDIINTLEGYEKVTGYNGDVVYTDSYEINEDGEYEKTSERMLTLNEIAHLMKEADGHNHKVSWSTDIQEDK